MKNHALNNNQPVLSMMTNTNPNGQTVAPMSGNRDLWA